jgi:replication-associated recombination protein RarA
MYMNEKQLIQRPSKEELFTDRQEFLEAFEGALTDLTPDAFKVLVFHGPPGIGKTAIREELIRRLGKGEYPGADVWGLFQFDAETRNAPDVALAILSGQLNASWGVPL